MTAEQAIERKDTVLGYNVSKTQAEMAAWEFMRVNPPSYDLVVINPDIITGPMIHPVEGPKSINETNQFAIGSFIDGTHKEIQGLTFPFYHFVSFPPSASKHSRLVIEKVATLAHAPCSGGRARRGPEPC